MIIRKHTTQTYHNQNINVRYFRKICKQFTASYLHSNIKRMTIKGFVKRDTLVCFQIKTGPVLSPK